MTWIIEKINWFKSLLGKNPWFTHDKFAHGWINTITTRIFIRYANYSSIKAIIVSVLIWIGYEIADLIWHCYLVKEEERLKFRTYVIDSLRDICWDIGGAFIGGLI